MVALRRGDIEVDVLSGDGTGLGIIGTVDVVLLQHDFLLVGSQLRHLLGDQGGTTVGQMGSGEDQVDLGQFTTTGLGVEQPDERESDGVLDGKEEEGPSTDRSSYETRTRQSAGIFRDLFQNLLRSDSLIVGRTWTTKKLKSQLHIVDTALA